MRRSIRVELGVPVEIVAPALMQVVGREGAAILLQHVRRRLHRAVPRIHPALARQSIALEEIAGGAGGDDVGPDWAPATRSRKEMVEGQVVRRIGLAAILAGKAVTQKDVEPGKCRMPCR